jgi:uncharacterized membrane protein
LRGCGAAVSTAPGAVTQSAVAATGAAIPSASTMATNVVGALAYLAGFVTGIVFLVIEPYKNDSLVRFHAYQSIFFNVAWLGFWIVWMFVSAILTHLTAGIFGLIALPLVFIFSFLGFACWAFLMYQAYQQKFFTLPLIGNLAAQQAGVKL